MLGWGGPSPPVILGVVFSGFFLLLSCFGGVFWVLLVFILLLFSDCVATVLLDWLVGVVSMCFSGSFRRGEGRNVSDGVFYYLHTLSYERI